MFPTPDLSHLTRNDYNQIYEPDADSFLLLDALELKLNEILEQKPFIIFEFGSGSGLITTFVAKHFCLTSCLFFAIDINPYACYSTKRTFQQNNLHKKHCLNIIQCNLADPLIDRLSSKVDLILFNPPYVPTETSDVKEVIERTYAGGKQGIEVIEKAIEQASRLLSSKGLFYMVALEENNFDTLKELANQVGLNIDIILKRRTLIERLFVMNYSLFPPILSTIQYHQFIAGLFGGIISPIRGLQGLYGGVTSNVVGNGISLGLYLFIYNTIIVLNNDQDKIKNLTFYYRTIYSTTAGLLTIILTNPMWVIKTRMCLQYSNNKTAITYNNMFDAFRKTYQSEGITAFYKCLTPGLVGIFHGTIQFSSYEQMKSFYVNPFHTTYFLTSVVFTFSALSKFIAATSTYPT
ncbi:unnamed protein product [Rotaria sordida]|uniref:Methyltransferase HEMK2 n=2 Tax=Rotaria sordida TaxID=392033 RepID=A0A818WG97_9BILA|nr:unnamed protein product [Rotaria sordida]